MNETQQPKQDPKPVREKPNYVREQKGHSLIKHILLCCVGIGMFTIPDYSLSKNHYWHA